MAAAEGDGSDSTRDHYLTEDEVAAIMNDRGLTPGIAFSSGDRALILQWMVGDTRGPKRQDTLFMWSAPEKMRG